MMNQSEQLLKLLNAYKLSNALFVAAEHRLFDYVGKKSSIEEIAGKSGFDAEALEVILQVFCAKKLLKQEEGNTYTLDGKWKELLDSRSKISMIPLMKLEGYLAENHNTKSAMERALCSGKGKDILNENAKEGKADVYGMAMDAGGQFSSVCIAREFRNIKSGRILDAGGGAGTCAVRICRYNQRLNVDIIDKPEMEDVCMKNIIENGLEDRIKFIRGDIFEMNLRHYEGILVSNIMHLFSNEANKKLLKKLQSSLRYSGLLVIHDFILDDAHTQDSAASDSTLDWLVLGSKFHADAKKIKDWLEEIQLQNVKVKRFQEIPTSIVTAEKPRTMGQGGRK